MIVSFEGFNVVEVALESDPFVSEVEYSVECFEEHLAECDDIYFYIVRSK